MGTRFLQIFNINLVSGLRMCAVKMYRRPVIKTLITISGYQERLEEKDEKFLGKGQLFCRIL